MEMKWHIDAWAPTDGLVFASKRDTSVDLWSQDASRLGTTLAITAPNFEPTPVDRSVAFGAVRRGFQERFSLDGEGDYQFDSLLQLTQFVRRIYSGSGPGTMGGGEPVDGGPGPSGDDGDSSSFITDFLQSNASANGESEKRLLLDWYETSPAKRAAQISQCASGQARFAAARLLVCCARAAFQNASIREAIRLSHAAASLTDSDQQWHDLCESASPGLREVMRHLLDGWFPHPFIPLEIATPHLDVAAHVPIPANCGAKFGLPSKARSMLDVVSYVAADRQYILHASVNGLMPLLLAVAANFCAHATDTIWHDAPFRTRSLNRTLERYGRFIGDWLPLAELPSDLEQEVHAWCLKTPERQREPSLDGRSRSA